MSLLERGLHSRSGLVRKGSALLLGAPRRLALAAARPEDYRRTPPVLANSFPKSGTHLLDQIVAGLPDRANYGVLLSSLTSSFQLRELSPEATCRRLRAIVPGELMRGHIFYDPRYAAALAERNAAHYFIYRDPRDVVVSSCHYLRDMNRWHKLHKYFAECATLEDAILLSIRGLKHQDPTIPLPNVAERFAAYAGWVDEPQTLAVKFEDLRGPEQDAWIERIVDFYFYAAKCAEPIDRAATLDRIRRGIDPQKSHTFRLGKGGGWRDAFTPRCREAFKEVAGDLLVRLGYEQDHRW